MGNISCELFIHSNSPHLQQLYAGFKLLQAQGVIKLLFHVLNKKTPDLLGVGPNSLKVILNGEKVLMYDTFDGHQINSDVLNNVDFYFKRSYLSSEVAKIDSDGKVFPLGLNYLLYEPSPSVFFVRRAVLEKTFLEKAKYLTKMLGFKGLFSNSMIYVPRPNTCFAYPDYQLPPRVLFMTHLWDPDTNSVKAERLGLDKKAKEIINEMRVGCVRVLKRELGPRFYGGIAPDEYSKRFFGDCILPNDQLARKGSYMALLRQYPIGVATTGLFGSVGWKFAEYISHSKAIVSEKLNYKIPGSIDNEKNYLEFANTDECVSAAIRLMDDHALRYEMMLNNYHYYQSYLKPDSLILNTITTALTNS
jgi:hypothetical protein